MNIHILKRVCMIHYDGALVVENSESGGQNPAEATPRFLF